MDFIIHAIRIMYHMGNKEGLKKDRIGRKPNVM